AGRLLAVRGQVLVVERQRRVRAGDPAVEGRDPRGGGRARGAGGRERAWRRGGGAGDLSALEKLAPRVGGLRGPCAELGNVHFQRLRSRVLVRESLKRPHERRSCHFAPPRSVWEGASTIRIASSSDGFH